MPSYADRLLRTWDGLEAERKVLLASLKKLPEETYRAQPSIAGWSVAQAANHLFLSEQASMQYLRKKMQAPDAVPGYHPASWFGLQGLRLVFRSPLRWRAPKIIDMWGDQPVLSAEDLEKEWAALRQEMKEQLTAYAGVIGNRRAYRHPRAGRMSLRHMLLFFQTHIRHHEKQIRRILRQLETPGTSAG